MSNAVKFTVEEAKAKLLQITGWINEIEAMKHQVEVEMHELYKKCPHQESEYIPDPSGNNDSGYKCLICGKYSRKRFMV